MFRISEQEVTTRLEFDNPWWRDPEGREALFQNWRRKRAYFDAFVHLVMEQGVQRAVILMGPRRVGKTVMLQQTIQRLLETGQPPASILYLSLDTPTYMGLRLEQLLHLFQARHKHRRDARLYVFFDEIQYHGDWEVHLKSLVDSYPRIRFVASGSAAAALRLKSRESGAGRFTDFLLPPLTFAEYLDFTGREEELIIPAEDAEDDSHFANDTRDIARLNEEFIRYLNYGGFPEAALSDAVQANPVRFIQSDIIDKVVLRDLPSLYGIENVQEMYRLFTALAYNTGNEASPGALAQLSGVVPNTLDRYMEYMEAAFLVRRIYRVDQSGHRFKRITSFKVHLTNPTMRAALFGPIGPEDNAMGHLAETAIIGQWLHSDERLCYARWKSGREDREVDLVHVPLNKPVWAVEIKWSDRYFDHPERLTSLIEFAQKNELDSTTVTTRTKRGLSRIAGLDIYQIPTSLYCYEVGKNLVHWKVNYALLDAAH